MPVFVGTGAASLYDRIEHRVRAVILKRIFFAKDLPRCLRQKCRELALDQRTPRAWVQSLESAIQFEIFGEILRANDALQDDNRIESITKQQHGSTRFTRRTECLLNYCELISEHADEE